MLNNAGNIRKDLEKTYSELKLLVSSFNQRQLNAVPFKGSWTGGQSARHLVKSAIGFMKLINGPVKKTDRPIDEKVDTIKKDFLDFSIRTESADDVYPEDIYYSKEELLNDLGLMYGKFIKAAEEQDMSETCILFELPVYGALTRLEALYFVVYHTQRHIHQLKNIFRKVKMKPFMRIEKYISEREEFVLSNLNN